MALSDYLTNEEWNASVYIFFNPNVKVDRDQCGDLGSTMHLFIKMLIDKGYVFQGLDENGIKKQQISSDNANKFVSYFFGGAKAQEVVDWLRDGRKFLKEYLPEILETDEEFESAINLAKDQNNIE